MKELRDLTDLTIHDLTIYFSGRLAINLCGEAVGAGELLLRDHTRLPRRAE